MNNHSKRNENNEKRSETYINVEYTINQMISRKALKEKFPDISFEDIEEVRASYGCVSFINKSGRHYMYDGIEELEAEYERIKMPECKVRPDSISWRHLIWNEQLLDDEVVIEEECHNAFPN